MNAYKILDLFSGTQSVRKALDKMNIEYEYYGIDIYSPEEENIILDLSQNDVVNKLIKVLPKDWKPDFIWASPICDKFSIACAVKGGNVYFEKTKEGVKIREDFKPLENSVYKNKKHNEIIEQAKKAIKIVENMNKIIKYYDCNFIIENPYSSYMKYYLKSTLIRNKVDYCMYGYNYQKPTAIYSEKELNLKKCNHKNHGGKIGTTKNRPSGYNGCVTTYQERASVPTDLIIDILNHFV